jgi:hypothetical protein
LKVNINPEYRNFANVAGKNNATYLDYYERLRLLALSRFQWLNLPKTMDERFLERTLYSCGLGAFVFDDDLGFINLKCTPSNSLNIYENATEYTCFSLTYNKKFKEDDLVLVRNNLDNLPTDMTIQLFAERLANAERIIDVNINAQKTPVLLKCPENLRLTLKNLYMQYDGNEPFIFGDKELDIDTLAVLKTDAPYVADKIAEYKRNLWSDALTFLGLNNVATEKGERLITDEVNANNEMVSLSAETMLLTRKKACEDFNEKFNMNIDVKLRTFNNKLYDNNYTPEMDGELNE